MCMSLYEKLSLMLAAATLAVNIIFLFSKQWIEKRAAVRFTSTPSSRKINF